MSAKIILRKKEYDVRHGISIREAMKNLGINVNSVIPTKEGELVSHDSIIEEGDVIRLVTAISGG